MSGYVMLAAGAGIESLGLAAASLAGRTSTPLSLLAGGATWLLLAGLFWLLYEWRRREEDLD